MKALLALLRQHFFEYATYSFLATWTVVQGIYSRSFRFDSLSNAISTVEQVAQQVRPPSFWLNVQVNFVNSKLLSTLLWSPFSL